MKITFSALVNDVRNRAGGIVFSNWRGIATARLFRAPTDPNSARQRIVRDLFAGANELYLEASAALGWRALWWDAARGRPLIGRNLFLGNIVEYGAELPARPHWGGADFFPLGGSALAKTAIGVAPSAGTLTVTASLTAAPIAITGFTLYAVAIALPNTVTQASLNAGRVVSGPWGAAAAATPIVIDGLEDVEHRVGVIGVYLPTNPTLANYRAPIHRGTAIYTDGTPT